MFYASGHPAPGFNILLVSSRKWFINTIWGSRSRILNKGYTWSQQNLIYCLASVFYHKGNHSWLNVRGRWHQWPNCLFLHGYILCLLQVQILFGTLWINIFNNVRHVNKWCFSIVFYMHQHYQHDHIFLESGFEHVDPLMVPSHDIYVSVPPCIS